MVVLATGVCVCLLCSGVSTNSVSLAANTQRGVKGGSPSSLKIKTCPKWLGLTRRDGGCPPGFEAHVHVFPPIRLTRLSMCAWINGAAGSGGRR